MSKHQNPNCPQGVIVINKHEGVTSYRIVQVMRKMFDTSSVGHTGTLDPMATGVLPVLIGRAVKASDYVTAGNKEYIAEFRLGLTTDTQDITGETLSQSDKIPDENEVFEVAKSFIGEIQQIPPMYSAIKINGQKLVDLAREGKEIEREARDITIYYLDIEHIDALDYKMTVGCSKGTYIRTLCADIGEKLGCGATLTKLKRTKSGNFSLSGSYTLEDLEKMSLEERYSIVKPTELLFEDCESIYVNDFYAKLIKGGTELYQKKLGTDFELHQRIKIYHNNKFIALGEVNEYEDKTAIKPIRLFEL